MPVPSLRGLSMLETAEVPDTGTLAAKSPDRKGSDWSAARGNWGAVLLGIAAICFVIGSYFAYERFKLDTSANGEKELEANYEMIDQMSATQLSFLWRNYVQFNLKEKNRPDFYYVNIMATEKVISASGFAAAGLLLTIGAVVVLSGAKKKKPE